MDADVLAGSRTDLWTEKVTRARSLPVSGPSTTPMESTLPTITPATLTESPLWSPVTSSKLALTL